MSVLWSWSFLIANYWGSVYTTQQKELNIYVYHLHFSQIKAATEQGAYNIYVYMHITCQRKVEPQYNQLSSFGLTLSHLEKREGIAALRLMAGTKTPLSILSFCQ